MSLEPGHVLVILAGVAPAAWQVWRSRRRARAEWQDANLDARAQAGLSAGPAVLRGRVDVELSSMRQLCWGVPDARDLSVLVDVGMATRDGPVRLAGPLVIRSGTAAREPSPPDTGDGSRVLWRQSLRIAPGSEFLCAGELAESPGGEWMLRGDDTSPLRAHASAVMGTRTPLLPARLAIAGLALAVCAALTLYGIGRAAEDELRDAFTGHRPEPRLWSAACAFALGCDAPKRDPEW